MSARRPTKSAGKAKRKAHDALLVEVTTHSTTVWALLKADEESQPEDLYFECTARGFTERMMSLKHDDVLAFLPDRATPGLLATQVHRAAVDWDTRFQRQSWRLARLEERVRQLNRR